jgi:hypothetical protein
MAEACVETDATGNNMRKLSAVHHNQPAVLHFTDQSTNVSIALLSDKNQSQTNNQMIYCDRGRQYAMPDQCTGILDNDRKCW